MELHIKFKDLTAHQRELQKHWSSIDGFVSRHNTVDFLLIVITHADPEEGGLMFELNYRENYSSLSEVSSTLYPCTFSPHDNYRY
jgi:hypothetical protein